MRISDWSSDVCSSDLFHGCLDFARHGRKERLAVTDQLRPPPALILRHSRASPPQNRQRKSPAGSLRRGSFRLGRWPRGLFLAFAFGTLFDHHVVRREVLALHLAERIVAERRFGDRKSTRLKSSH